VDVLLDLHCHVLLFTASGKLADLNNTKLQNCSFNLPPWDNTVKVAFGYLPSHPLLPLPANRNLYLELGWKPGNGYPGNCNRVSGSKYG